MPVNSRRKGKAGELKAAHFLHALGFPDARRTAQHNGREGQCGDVVCPDTLPNVHIECKVTGRGGGGCVDLGKVGLDAAVEQARRDAPAGHAAAVLWRVTGCRADYNLTWWDEQRQVRLTVDRREDVAAALRFLDATAGGGA